MSAAVRQYADLYTWSHDLGEHVLAHQDGAASLLVEWAGFDTELMSETERANTWTQVYTLLGAIGPNYCAEFHLWREQDRYLADEYLAHSKHIIRGGEFAHALREAQAEHLAPYGMRNSVGVVLTRLPQTQFFLGAKRALRQQARNAEELLERAHYLMPNLPGARLGTRDEYAARIQQSIDRAGFVSGARVKLDPLLLVSEQLIPAAPRLEDGRIVMAGKTSKALLVYLYPDAAPGWAAGIPNLSIPMHLSHIVRPIQTKAALKASEREGDFALGTIGRRGRNSQAKAATAITEWQQFVSMNNLDIYRNAFVIHLHGTPEEIDNHARALSDAIQEGGGQVRDSDYVQLPYFRAGQPGQGYRAPIFRSDHTWQVGNMLPVQVHRAGEMPPESLRLGRAGQLISFPTTSQVVPHSFTVAMTGAGKGVEKTTTIAETYPLGIDWYIAEIGGSYRWVVEGFGGVYSRIDPRDTAVNPLPPYSSANPDEPFPLDAVQAGGTINALAFLLADGRTELTVHESAAAQAALQLLYAAPPAGANAPTLPDFLSELYNGREILQSEPQRAATIFMAQNLESFLETSEGRIFTRPDNLVLSEGITGVDLKEVDRASPKLLKFYLVFLSLRFNHLAFARRNPARVLLDEMHKFIAIAPEVVGKLISELARMGRKDAAAIDIVTQGLSEIDIIEKEVLNSMPLRSLLYRNDEWEEIGERINMPAGALQVWKDYEYPLNLPWRPGMRSVGPDYYNLFLTFPHLLLDLSATSPSDLDLKEEIGSRVADPLARLAEFRAIKQQRSRP